MADEKEKNPDQSSNIKEEDKKDDSKGAAQFAQLSIDEKNRLLANQAALINEMRSNKTQLESRMAELERKGKEPPAPTGADLAKKNKEFYDNPIPSMRELIRAELKESVAPLIEFRNKMEARSEYDVLKGNFRANPKFAEMLKHPEVEAVVDNLMKSNPPTEAAMYSILAGVRGAIELGDMPKPQGWASPGDSNKDGKEGKKNESVKTQIPPHLRPSSPPGPSDEKKGEAVRELNEHERRLARENGQTPEEYLAELDGTPLVLKEDHSKKNKNDKTANAGAK